MPPDQGHNLTVKDLLDQALKLVPADRSNFLDRACAGAPGLRQEVESALQDHSTATEGALSSIVTLGLGHLQLPAGSLVGRRLGPYEVVASLGEGGMGSVYRAARADRQYEKQVAIKVAKQGLHAESMARFRAERQILAGLEHPNIARLLDGGTTESGLPYLVMELVEGQPIDQYCAIHKLSLEERLQLFRTVCQAVQYAHQHLVVHRDLKPGNILVTADGTPKLLDFGIAKILDPASFPGGAEATMPFMMMLTPEYASPEQVRGDPITTASDVYSLGVVLYLLLTGRHPYRLEARTPELIVRMVCETEPVKPSTAVRIRDSAGAGPLAGALDLPPRTLRRRLRGDLDNIVLTALHKQPERRYPSAEQFAEDIRRHLDDLPVQARTDTVAYRASKFVQRHKAASAASLAVALTLLAALLVTLREARIARQEAQLANRQAEIAREQSARAERRFNDVRKLANSLMFEIHDSIKDLPGATKARELLVTRAREYLDSLARETSDPSLQHELAAAYDRIGDVQGYVGAANLLDFSGASESYSKALAIRESLAAANPGDPKLRGELTDDYFRIASALENIGDFEGDLHTLQRALVFLHGQPDEPRQKFRMAGIYYYTARALEKTGNYPGALQNYQQALATFEPIAGDPRGSFVLRGYLACQYQGLARMQARLGRLGEAETSATKALSMLQKLSEANPTNATVREYLAESYDASAEVAETKGDLAGALQLLRQARAIDSELAGADPGNRMAHANLAWADLNIGENLLRQNKTSEALACIRRATAVFERSELSLAYAHAVDLGQAYLDMGRVYVALAENAASAEDRAGFWRSARAWTEKALTVRSTHPSRLDSSGHDQVAEIRQQLARCTSALAVTSPLPAGDVN